MGAEAEEDTSLSFLEAFLAFPVDNGAVATSVAHASEDIEPEVVGPTFLGHKIEIPRKIEALFKAVSQISFIYKIVDGDRIVVRDMDSGVVCKSIRICKYEDGPRCTECCLSKDELYSGKDDGVKGTGELLFVIGRERYETTTRREKQKRYRKAVEEGTAIFCDTETSWSRRQEWLKYQIHKGCNVVYIETGEELHSRLKSLVDKLTKRVTFTPRVTRHSESEKKAYLRDFLSRIPGVSLTAAQCVVERYPDFISLTRALEMSIEEVSNMIVAEEDGSRVRKLGSRAVKKILHALSSTSPGERI